ncbi:LOW QUALITY PROTEIN: hypothetical protein Cgig2_014112 [Carnegiea gigantea]|uniref:Uncharacterized protein n=1 Tax=Carnegiea gigantea TaxID=171969 RepID=A0A9Q1KWU4_9CARY|nr:LOW QUALITY PROTEIN: hypothetical protein Cgig2_014112 [Carnegiea gigantea]
MVGFFPRSTKGGAYGQNNLITPNLGSREKGVNKVLKCTFLACWLTRCCLSSSRRRSASAATRSGVASPVSKTVNLALACSSGQNQTEKLTNIGTTNTLRKILKDQKPHRSKEEVFSKKLQLREPIQRFPITRLALPPLRALHKFYRLSHKLGDGSRLIVLPYVELEITGRFSFLSCRLPKGVSNRLTLIPVMNATIMNPDLLLKQYHPKPPVSLGVLWTICTRLNARAEQFILVQNLFNHWVKRKSKTIVESRVINSYTLGRRLIHGGIRLGDYKGVPSRHECRNDPGVGKVTVEPSGGSEWVRAPGKSSPSATISGTSPTGKRPFLLSTDLPGAGVPLWDEERVDAPSKDEPLDELSEEDKEVSPEIELVLVEATSTPGFDELGAE